MDIFQFIISISDSIKKAILSQPLDDKNVSKIEFKKIQISKKESLQKSYILNNQAFHTNYSLELGLELLNKELSENYKQLFLQLDDRDIHIFKTKNGWKKKEEKKDNSLVILDHNRKKNCFYIEGQKIPHLIETSIMDTTGKIKEKMRPKWNQVNKFLEICEPQLRRLREKQSSIHCVDIGCGKGYLTFSLFDLLKKLDFKEIKFIGLDLKSDVVISNQQIAKRLQLEGLEFLNINADDYRSNMPIDLVIALHACDCATDIAIKLATKWQTKMLFLAPCCHQYLNKQIKCEELQPLLKYGILKERFSALLTDALRVSHLEDRGYNCDVIEFVDREDSLKNVLIKAIYSENKNRAKNTKSENLKNLFHIKPWLDIEG